MKLQNILSSEEIEGYHKEWESFRKKYKQALENEVLSGKPKIGQVFQYKDKPVFRAHVFQRKLREIDPYEISKKYYLHPIWHTNHYLTTLEQLYHASMLHIKYIYRIKVKEPRLEFRLSDSVFWDDRISVELIWKIIRQTRNYDLEDCHFSFYDDKNKKIKATIDLRNIVGSRAYVQCIEKLKQGDSSALKTLIRKIEAQDLNHNRLINPRKKLKATKDYLISELKRDNIPEEEIHDFFSLWD